MINLLGPTQQVAKLTKRTVPQTTKVIVLYDIDNGSSVQLRYNDYIRLTAHGLYLARPRQLSGRIFSVRMIAFNIGLRNATERRPLADK